MGIPGYGQWIKDTNAMDQRRTGMLQSVCSTFVERFTSRPILIGLS
jgi:hypothetical protein